MQRNNNSLLNNRVDQRYNSHNSYIKTDNMDKPKSILTNRKNDSSRDHFISDLRHGYSTTFLDGFSYKDEEEELERVNILRSFTTVLHPTIYLLYSSSTPISQYYIVDITSSFLKLYELYLLCILFSTIL